MNTKIFIPSSLLTLIVNPLKSFHIDEGLTDSTVSKTCMLIFIAVKLWKTHVISFLSIFANMEHILLYRTYRIVKHKLSNWLPLSYRSHFVKPQKTSGNDILWLV